jgi:hypothetical protein
MGLMAEGPRHRKIAELSPDQSAVRADDQRRKRDYPGIEFVVQRRKCAGDCLGRS